MAAHVIVTEGCETGLFVGCGLEASGLAGSILRAGVAWETRALPCCLDGAVALSDAGCWSDEVEGDPDWLRMVSVVVRSRDRALEERG